MDVTCFCKGGETFFIGLVDPAIGDEAGVDLGFIEEVRTLSGGGGGGNNQPNI